MESFNKAAADLPDTIQDGWFTETETLWPGQKFSLALDVSLYTET